LKTRYPDSTSSRCCSDGRALRSLSNSETVNTLLLARHPNVTAILAAHYPGEQSGNSIVDVLWEEQGPAGRLPYTILETEEDYGFPIVNDSTNDTDPRGRQADFTKGQMIDYKSFDARNVTPLYEFGFGLSCTTFKMSSLEFNVIEKNFSASPDPSRLMKIGGHPDLWEDVIEVSLTLSNTETRSGRAVPQLYLSFPVSTSKDNPVKLHPGRGLRRIHTLE